MRKLIFILSVLLSPAAASAQNLSYDLPPTLPEPAAQLTEMLSIYDDVCFHAFPDDAAVAQNMSSRQATALTQSQVQLYLRGDPGTGWFFEGNTGRFVLTVEYPPYHACAVRTLTESGFPDLQPYNDFVTRYNTGRSSTPLDPMEMVVGNIRTRGWGEQIARNDGLGEGLLVFMSTPVVRSPRDRLGTEVRFVHQLVSIPRT